MPYSLTYPSYENRSGWNLMLDKLPYENPLRDIEKKYDFVIIGAGFTGFSCAIRLAELEPEKSILIIEATVIGEGSSGRNSGFLLPSLTASNIGNDKLTQFKLYQGGLDWLEEMINKLGIDCDWSSCPKIDAAATPLGINNVKNKAKGYAEIGVNYRELSREELYEKTGTEYYSYGLEVHNNTFIQPAKLMRGYAKSLPANVTLIESTPVIRIEKGKPNKVVTRNAEFFSDKIILANNGFAKNLGYLKERLVTIYTYAGITPALSEDESASHGADQEWGIIPAHRLGTTLRKLKNNRFMVRSEYSYEKPITQYRADKLLKECYYRRFPNLKSHELEFVWGGVTALTFNGEAYFGQCDESGIYVSAGCNGAGGIKGSTHGKYLAEMVAGYITPELEWLLQSKKASYIPPEPFRGIGAKTSIYYQRRQAGLER